MSNGGFAALREAVAERLKRAMPKEVHVATSPGVVDEGEIARVSMKAPALLVSILDVLSVDHAGGASAANLRMGVYLITAPGRTGLSPDSAALAILPGVLACIDGEDWDVPDVLDRPENLRADNLYSGRLGNIGLLALWGVSWEQRVALPDEEPEDDLAEFLRCELAMTDADSGLRTDDIFNVRTGEPVTFDRSGLVTDAKRSESVSPSPLTQCGARAATPSDKEKEKKQ